MADMLIYFCLSSNQLYQPHSWVEKSKEYFILNEAFLSRANLNADKKIRINVSHFCMRSTYNLFWLQN